MSTRIRLPLAVAVLAFGASASPAAGDDGVALPDERHVLVMAAASGQYDRLPGDLPGASFGLSARALAGRRLGYCAGVDADVGASREGALYAAEAYLAGGGVRFGDAGFVSLCGGIGVGGASGVVPAALQVPVELRANTQLGKLRVSGWATARFTPLSDARRGGSRFSGIDELEATAAIGLGAQQTYWGDASAGTGPYLAVTYRELLGERTFGLALGIELLGAN